MTIYILKIYGLLLLLLSLSSQSKATIIESGAAGKLAVQKEAMVLFKGGIDLHVKAEASGNAVTDLAAQACLDVSGTAYSSNEHVTVSGWGPVGLTASGTTDKIGYHLQLSNNCTVPLRRYFALWDTRNVDLWEGDWYEVPAKTACSLDVNTIPAIPLLRPGNAVKAINLTTSASGNGVVSFKPERSIGDRGEMINGNNYLTYFVQGANWDMSRGVWSGITTGTYALKIDDVPRSTVPGVYKGTMVATISCE